MNYLASANETLSLYTQAISQLNQRLDSSFNQAVDMI
ncbi:phosphosugar isomerase [Actinobacillus equuli]|nr:phosphosugar isomerase [Actinobacillus equuli]